MKKILIVEDDKDFLWILRQTFEAQGFSVAYALDGQEGVAAAQKEHPDLIIMDILLPKMDGISAVREIRGKGINAQVIFLTNFNDVDHVSKAMDAGGQTDYIVKSDVHMDAIVKRVKDKLGME